MFQGCQGMLKCGHILVFLGAIDTVPWTLVNALKSETHLRNAHVNKASSVNKGIAKTCLIVDMISKNWSWIAVAGYGFHYFVSARFATLKAVANFSTAERFKYLFFAAINVHTMSRIVKKQNNYF